MFVLKYGNTFKVITNVHNFVIKQFCILALGANGHMYRTHGLVIRNGRLPVARHERLK